MKNIGVFSAAILEFAFNTFGTEAEHLWARVPSYSVFRHPNGKWYGIIMDITKDKLGLNEDGKIDILVAKCEPILKDMLLQQEGFLPAYHMNRENWITVLLDGSVQKELAFHVLSHSYELTQNNVKKRSLQNLRHQ